MESLFADLIAPLTAFAEAHAEWAGPIVFAVCLAESLLLVALFVPTTLILIALGGLATAGLADMGTLVAWGVAGAGLGYWISYVVGSVWGEEIESMGWLARRPELVARGHRFFARWGALAVVASRFVGPARAIVPVLAGTLGVRPLPFHVASWLSALLWVPAALAPTAIGAWLAAEMEALPDGLRTAVSMGLIVAVWLLIRTALRART